MDQDDSLFDKSKESYSQFTLYVQMNQQMFLSKMLECSIKSLPGQNHPPSHRCRSLIVIIAKMIRRGLGTLLMLMLVIHFDICHTMTADRLIKSDWPQWWHVSLNNGRSTISSTKPQTGLNAIQEGSNLNDGRRNTTQWSISDPHMMMADASSCLAAVKVGRRPTLSFLSFSRSLRWTWWTGCIIRMESCLFIKIAVVGFLVPPGGQQLPLLKVGSLW